MKIYLPEKLNSPSHTVYVQPGCEFPVSDWMDDEGKPRMFSVAFRFGCAEVPDNLGGYMLDKQLAKRSPILLPTDF